MLLGVAATYMMRQFFFNDTATTEIYTLSLHDALPIFVPVLGRELDDDIMQTAGRLAAEEGEDLDEGGAVIEALWVFEVPRSEEHTSELQSRQYLVCRLLLEKKKQ